MDSAKIRLWLSGAWRSRTMWAAGGVAALGALEERSSMIFQVLGQHTAGVVMLTVGALIAILRAITTTSLIEKAPDAPPTP